VVASDAVSKRDRAHCSYSPKAAAAAAPSAFDFGVSSVLWRGAERRVIGRDSQLSARLSDGADDSVPA